jgi:hypothetical protein
VEGNFLKLYLFQAYSIENVRMISRSGNSYTQRMLNTEVRVYSTTSGGIEVSSCGKITGYHLLSDKSDRLLRKTFISSFET